MVVSLLKSIHQTTERFRCQLCGAFREMLCQQIDDLCVTHRIVVIGTPNRRVLSPQALAVLHRRQAKVKPADHRVGKLILLHNLIAGCHVGRSQILLPGLRCALFHPLLQCRQVIGGHLV